MIKQRQFGRTGLRLSELCLGTLNFGWKTDEKTAAAILDVYHAAEGRFIQATSHTPEPGLASAAGSVSEEIVGRWWTLRGHRRHDLFLATRILVRRMARDDAAFAQQVKDAVRRSLRRLQTHYLDLVIFEWDEGLVPLRGTLEAFNGLVRAGLARYVGAGNFPVWRVADALGRAYLRNHGRFEAMQADYSLLTRARFEPEAMALAQEQRLAFLARSPLAGGYLARAEPATALNTAHREWAAARFGNGYGDMARTAVANVAARHGVSVAQVALAWVLHNPAVTSAVIGVRSVAQLGELVQGSALGLTPADLELLDAATAVEEVRVVAPSARHVGGQQSPLLLQT